MMKDYVAIAIRYAEDVVSGEIVAGKYIIKACQRFLDEIDNPPSDFYLSVPHANAICAFAELSCRHPKGPLAGQPVILEPFQVFALVNMEGWRSAEDLNILRFTYIIYFVARKNAKSFLLAVIAKWRLIKSGEGARIYSIATKRDQAKLVWEDCGRMIQKAPAKVSGLYKSTTSTISCAKTWSKYEAVGRDSRTLDGLNPSLNIFDEAGNIIDRNVIEVMTSATGARDSFQNIFITTAYFSKETAFFEQYDYAKKILNGTAHDDRYFAMLYELDEGDEWDDDTVWIKANPGLDTIIDKDYLRSEVNQAKEMSSKRTGVMTKHLNIWCNTADAWMPTDNWDKSTITEQQFDRSGVAHIGFDLSLKDDLTAVCTLFASDGCFHADWQFFLPYDTYRNIPSRLKQMYRQAVEDGILTINDGENVDYNYVQDHVLNLCGKYEVRGVGFDPFNAQMLVQNLTNATSIPMLPVRQGPLTMSPASKETERLITLQDIKHHGHPFVRWQLENCSYTMDSNDNIHVKKGDDPQNKIDGIVALIMAVSLAAGTQKPKKTSGIYISGMSM